MLHPQVAHNQAICTFDDPVLGALTQLGVLSDFSRTPMKPHGARAAQVVAPPQLPPARFEQLSAEGEAQLPLSGLRVLEISNIVAGPAIGRVLGELGADVIKLEPPAGDLSRGFAGRTFFQHVNSNKRGICIDARQQGADEIVHRIVATCDAVVANVRPGATQRMGISPEKFPRLVESHVTAYGWDGPYGKSPGLAPIAQALTGFHLAQRGEGNPPTNLNLMAPTDYAGGILASGALVTFEPGARSAWHTHPAAQRLYVVSGVGLTQERGKPVQAIRHGDVVWCPPGVKHWHGASPSTAMTHLAVTGTLDGKNVNWMEKVSDEQYNAR